MRGQTALQNDATFIWSCLSLGLTGIQNTRDVTFESVDQRYTRKSGGASVRAGGYPQEGHHRNLLPR